MSNNGATLIDHTDFEKFPNEPYNGWVTKNVGWKLERKTDAGDTFLKFKEDSEGPMLAQLLEKPFRGLIIGRKYRLEVRTKALVVPNAHPTRLEFRRKGGADWFLRGASVTNPLWHIVEGTFTADAAEETLNIDVSNGWDPELPYSKKFYYPAFYSIELYLEPA
ncbi:hypothetical protein [Pseudomonas sp. nanlin1]|uniref:hypothetical protein n=1 Tax=Pseudomonas sp. nanlin1 TaxID=3040605 RepID=UPI0038901E1D